MGSTTSQLPPHQANSTPEEAPVRGPWAALRRFVRKPRVEIEVCELCAIPLGPAHDHLLELNKAKVACACSTCAILFADSGGGLYRRIPREVRRLHDFSMDDYAWESLTIPINLAFFAYSSAGRRMIASYPSPGGVKEFSLDTKYWNVIVERNPVLETFAPDVEALLVNRIGETRQYYRAPIDVCFRLVEKLRQHWRGPCGGPEVWKEIDEFFRELNNFAGGRVA